MTTTVEETLVLIKPDGVARNLTGEILRRIEAKGYQLVDLRMVQPDRDLLAAHYAEHEGKPFYEPLLEFMESGPVVAVRAPATASSRASARWPARPTRRRPRPARSAATSAATGGCGCSRTWCTAPTHPRRPRASWRSGSPDGLRGSAPGGCQPRSRLISVGNCTRIAVAIATRLASTITQVNGHTAAATR